MPHLALADTERRGTGARNLTELTDASQVGML
jgi:hypothetical protein